MLEDSSEPSPEAVDAVLRRGPWGAVALCGFSVLVVLAIWFLFYFFAFLPRGLLR